MSNKYLVACDGSPASGRAINYVIDQAQRNGASVLVAHVLEWSPYSFLTPTELEERHKRRGEELERAKAALVDPILASISDKGVSVDSVIKYGNVAESIARIADETGIDQIFIGRTGQSNISARVFGSVTGTLAQIAPVPCTIVP